MDILAYQCRYFQIKPRKKVPVKQYGPKKYNILQQNSLVNIDDRPDKLADNIIMCGNQEIHSKQSWSLGIGFLSKLNMKEISTSISCNKLSYSHKVSSHTTKAILTLKVLNVWKFTSSCSLKPLWSGMGEVVPARTSLTLHPPTRLAL